MPRVVHFEIHAAEPRKAIAVYQSVFGWRFQHWGGGPMGNVFGIMQPDTQAA